MTYELISYDVWGNKHDGYEVNQAFHTGQHYELDPALTDENIIQALKKQGLIRKRIRITQIEITGDDEHIYFDYKGRPEFELRKVL